MSGEDSKLVRSVAIVARSEQGAMRVGIAIGGSPVPVTAALLHAAIKVIQQTPLSGEQRALLVEAGVYEPPATPPDRAQLAPGVRLAVELGDGGDLHAHELEYALFLTPFQARHIDRLRNLVLAWWSAAQDTAPSDGALGEALVGWLQTLHSRELELQTVFDLHGEGLDTQLEPLIPLGQEAPLFAPVGVRLQIPERPARFQQVEGWKGLRDWAESLPNLVLGEPGGIPEGLALAGCLREAVAPLELADGEVLDLGHGSFLVGIGTDRIWVDPLHEGGAATAAVGRPAAVVLTKPRLSSCSIEMLLRLPKDVPILLPRPARGSIPNRMADLLRAVGFERVREVVPGDRHELWGGRIDVEPGSTTVQWRFQCHKRSLRFLPGPPVAGSSLVDRVFADLRADVRPGLLRDPWTLLDPVAAWLERPPPFDWNLLADQVPGTLEDGLVVYDTGGRYRMAAAGFEIDEPAEFRRFGPYAHWDERPQRVLVTLSRSGQRHN